VQALLQTDLPGRLTLALILFLFFTADLVQSAHRNSSLIAFMDNYSVRVIDPSVEDNRRIIWNEIVFMLER
jgi:hypothetical protein